MAFQRIKQGFQSAPAGDIEQARQCPYCGMDRQKFAHSRIWVEYDDGTTLGTCSIHCAAVDMAVHIDRVPVKIWVGDYETQKLIDAEEAAWVIGGDRMGVMTHRAKWAFSGEEAARAFVKAHGGEPSDFDGVLKATFEDMYQDLKMIREKRKKMRMMKMKQQKGE
ncbi:MAG: nitrous oxide reductase accessory protein NosL [Deltaproteobacteria bacterium]|nr:nitrous oxide reductase accessory protein NosL [Deltaproteobacteria bacterium]